MTPSIAMTVNINGVPTEVELCLEAVQKLREILGTPGTRDEAHDHRQRRSANKPVALRNDGGVSPPRQTPSSVAPATAASGLLSVTEVALALGFTEAKTRHLIRRGQIPCVTIGRRIYVAEWDLANLTRPAILPRTDVAPDLAPKRLVFRPRKGR